MTDIKTMLQDNWKLLFGAAALATVGAIAYKKREALFGSWEDDLDEESKAKAKKYLHERVKSFLSYAKKLREEADKHEAEAERLKKDNWKFFNV